MYRTRHSCIASCFRPKKVFINNEFEGFFGAAPFFAILKNFPFSSSSVLLVKEDIVMCKVVYFFTVMADVC
jgi:hypothetical protein